MISVPLLTLCGMRWSPLLGIVGVVSLAVGVQAAEPSGIQSARILDSQAVDFGDRIVTYQRIETPALLPQPAPPPRPPVIERTLTPEELEEQRQWEAKRYLCLFLSCTIYGGQITEIYLQHEGQEIRILSNVDFNNLSQLTDLVTDEAYYILVMGIGDFAKEDFRGPWPAHLINADRAAWQVVSGNPSEELVQALGDLHRHFDANKESLIAQRIERDLALAAHEQWLRENPPKAMDTTIQFFPIRSNRHGDAVIRQQ